MLKVENISKSYGSLDVIKNISFSIQPGEIVGLLGPNGAGKTTLINILLGLLAPNSGHIQIFNKEFPKHKSSVLVRMNFAASYVELPGNLSLKENLLTYALLYEIPYPEKIVEIALDDFALQKFKNRKTGTLSSGEKARANLAKALINSPKLLLLDEPTASLDPSSSQIICEQIRRYVNRCQASVLWTSHDMLEIEEFCHGVLFLSQGSILVNGRPAELLNRFGKRNLKDLFLYLEKSH